MDKKRFIKYGLIVLCFLFSIILFGCKQESIEFYRESPVQSFINSMQNQNTPEKKNNSGVIILKDDSSKKNSGTINFGPKEIDFSMPKH